jgi:hypothetical protein
MRALAIFLCACAPCSFEYEGICVRVEAGSLEEEDVRLALVAVQDECSLTVNETLTIAVLEDAPDRSQGGSPVPAVYRPQDHEVRLWAGYPRMLDSLRHELIHAGLHHAGEDTDGEHTDQELWCMQGCESHIVESCYSAQ